MKIVSKNFLQMLSFIRKDFMLAAACLIPFLTGIFFRFGIPYIEKILCVWLHQPVILTPYYGLLDLFFALITPVVFCFVSAMVFLEERDDHVTKYLFITPLRQRGYLISRIGLPAATACILTIILLPVFELTELSFPVELLLAVAGALQGSIMTLLIVTISKNKLEGMAVTKLASLMLLGALVPYFIESRIQYLFSFLPSFWLGKSIHGETLMLLPAALFISCIWMGVLLHKFLRKMET